MHRVAERKLPNYSLRRRIWLCQMRRLEGCWLLASASASAARLSSSDAGKAVGGLHDVRRGCVLKCSRCSDRKGPGSENGGSVSGATACGIRHSLRASLGWRCVKTTMPIVEGKDAPSGATSTCHAVRDLLPPTGRVVTRKTDPGGIILRKCIDSDEHEPLAR